MDLPSSTVIGMARNLRSACRNRWSASPECACTGFPPSIQPWTGGSRG